MRGVPAARYMDENTAVTEIEGRYYVTPRWIAVAFVGAARDWGRRSSFEDEGTIVAKGVGFRYMLARRMQFSLGIDIARGPEEDRLVHQDRERLEVIRDTALPL